MESKVHNDHHEDYKEEFKGTVITIPARDFVTMEHSEAVEFIGQFVPPRTDGAGNFTNVKMLRVERITEAEKPEETNAQDKFKCMACGRTDFVSERGLKKHILQKHPEMMLDREAKEAARKELAA